MLKVEVLEFDQLTESEREEYGSGDRWEYARFLRVTHNGQTLVLRGDAMESEDAFFRRDLAWVPGAIRQAYEFGVSDGRIAALTGVQATAEDENRNDYHED